MEKMDTTYTDDKNIIFIYILHLCAEKERRTVAIEHRIRNLEMANRMRYRYQLPILQRPLLLTIVVFSIIFQHYSLINNS